MRLRVKNALLHKLGFVQPPTFILPGRYGEKYAALQLMNWNTLVYISLLLNVQNFQLNTYE